MKKATKNPSGKLVNLLSPRLTSPLSSPHLSRHLTSPHLASPHLSSLFSPHLTSSPPPTSHTPAGLNYFNLILGSGHASEHYWKIDMKVMLQVCVYVCMGIYIDNAFLLFSFFSLLSLFCPFLPLSVVWVFADVWLHR